MASSILVNNLGLTYKSSLGISTATLPDVCKTPSPGGPVPIPYPNIADHSSLDKGTKTVYAHGKMIAIKGSEYSISFGDEPGTVGGVKSNTFKKETSWITYSFDVKMDDANACRHTDKKFHNHKNTVDLGGNLDPTLPLPSIEQALQKIAEDCEREVENDPQHKDKNCRDKGTEKHKCCDRKIEEEKAKQAKNEPQGVYSDGAFDANSGKMIERNNPVRGGIPSQVPRKRNAIIRQAIGFAASKGQPVGPAIAGALSGKKFPDVVIASDPTQPPGRDNTKAVYDFKFPCPKDKKPGWGDNGNQGDMYNEMLSPEQGPKMITPTGIFT